MFLDRVPTAWRAKSQHVVSLSSSEAEFCACLEAAREVPFMGQLPLFLNEPPQTPVKVWIDNVGAVFVTENESSSSRTRHMDTRWWHVSDMQEEDKPIKAGFIRTKENASDVGTKNVDTNTHKAHEGKMIKD